MRRTKEKYDDISVYFEDRERVSNQYVMKCYTIMMLIYTVAVVLNLLHIFIVDQTLMIGGYIPSLAIYLITYCLSKKMSWSNEKTKYFILCSIIVVSTIMGVTITYHVVYATLLPFLYATLYSSKPVMRFVYAVMVVSTVIIVYGGYYIGLCDANMALLTTGPLSDYIQDGKFILDEVNPNPIVSLMLFFVVPRCLIYFAFAYVCESIYRIVNGSIERAKLTAELEKAKEEAERANQAKTQFLARVSHELRTPINAVFGMNEMILRESKNQDVQKYAQDARDSSLLLINILNELLDSSKIESGMMEIVVANYEIGSLLNDLYNMVNLKAKEKNLKLVFDVDPEIPSGYFGDDKRIKQILLNLLTNAVKYTHHGNVTLKVTCDVQGKEALLHFCVKDTGIGIKKEDIGKIYDAFQRFDMDKNRDVEGTGLGMNIVQSLLKLMGSELWIQSKYEEGSEFSFALVQKVVKKEPVGDFRERIHWTQNNERYAASYTAEFAKILVVDDNVMNLKVFKALLKDSKMQITEAQSGKECLDLLKFQEFDMVFLDHMMPEMDGIETLKEIRKRKYCKGIPIVMLTANASVKDKEMYISEGFDDFLSKPIISEKLEQMIRNYLPKGLVHAPGEKTSIEEPKTECSIQPLEEFDFSYALNALQDEGILKKLLEEFGSALETQKEKLAGLFAEISSEESLHLYRLEVHALKSTAATVGALLLSKLARMLEVAAKEQNTDLIKTLHPVLMEEMEKHRERVLKIFPKETKTYAKSVEKAYLDMLELSLKNANYTTADFVCSEISKYEYPEEIENLVKELLQRIESLETEEALVVVDRIKTEAGKHEESSIHREI